MSTDPTARLRAAVEAAGGQAASIRLLADRKVSLPKQTLSAWLDGTRSSSSTDLAALVLELLAERNHHL